MDGPASAKRRARQEPIRDSVLANFVLGLADSAFDLTFGLVELAFHFQLGVAGDFAGGFLYRAFGLVGGAFDAILIHGRMPFCCICLTRARGRRSVYVVSGLVQRKR